MQAAGSGYTEEVSQLVRCPGLDINHMNGGNWTALLLASHHNRLHVVDLLLNDTRIKVNQVKASSGETALLLASKLNHTEIVK